MTTKITTYILSSLNHSNSVEKNQTNKLAKMVKLCTIKYYKCFPLISFKDCRHSCQRPDDSKVFKKEPAANRSALNLDSLRFFKKSSDKTQICLVNTTPFFWRSGKIKPVGLWVHVTTWTRTTLTFVPNPYSS